MGIDLSIYGVPGILGGWTPLELGSSVVTLWCKPESLIGPQTTEIAQWDDSSGNARHLTGSATKPTVVANVIDGYKGAGMVTGRHFIGPSNIDAVANDWEIYFVVDFDGCTASDKMIDVQTGRLIVGTDGSSNVAYHDGAYTEYGAIQAGIALYNLQLNAASPALYRNGVEKSVSSGDGYTQKAWNGGFMVGASYGGTSSWDGGPLVEILVLKGAQSAAIRTNAQAYFAAKYPTLSL